MTKGERLVEFLRRLTDLPAAGNFEEAWRQLETTLNHVEDELSGVPFDPVTRGLDGRLYPPQLDSEKAFPSHPRVRRFRHRNHNTLIGENGSIQIRKAARRPLDGEVVFSKPGADGKEVLDR